MGFFSWKTADTVESIRNVYSEEGAKTVYLLQPGDLPNVREDNYQGYGVFGDIDAYVWLARMNMPKSKLKGMDEDAIRRVGISMECSDYYVDKETGMKWGSSFHSGRHKELNMFDNYAEPIDYYDGRCANFLLSEGVWERRPMIELMLPKNRKYKPLKFSYDPDAKYEDLPASERDETQGYFGLPDKELYEHLLEAVLTLIRTDIALGDVAALEELLRFTPTVNLIGYLNEDQQELYEGLEDDIPVGKES